MKKCPQCSRTYSDDTLSFCLEDGALLSASYDPDATQSPTVAMNAPEIPPTVASQIPPTAAAQEIPTVVANQAPTVESQQTEDKKVRWYIYLVGFLYAAVYDFVLSRLLYDPFLHVIYRSTTGIPGLDVLGHTIFNILIFGILALLFGYIWSEAKWKWGVIVVLPELVALFTSFSNLSIISMIGYLFSFFLTIAVACIFSYLGSRLRQIRSNA